VFEARYSHQYWAERNRIGILVETHSWKDYATRVRVTRNTVVDLLDVAATRAAAWQRAAESADRRGQVMGGQPVALTYENTADTTPIDFLGYAYTREVSPVSGAAVTRYDTHRPEVWKVPLKARLQPSLTITAPAGGYIVPAAHVVWLGAKLRLHGIDVERLMNGHAGVDVETFRATRVTHASATFEGRTSEKIDGTWSSERRDVPPGSLFVPIGQPKARLLMRMLEPQDPDSFASWGFFSAAFERKEYMEAYVANDVALRMLAENPALKVDFENQLRDPAFARSPAARLEFFYRRHPSWDERFNLYPVFRIAQRPR